jgi:cytochrome P450
MITGCVIHESLRLYPPNWMLIPRRSREASELGGFRIPKGSPLYIFPYVIHRDARWFTAPDSFQPERFAPEHFGSVQRTAYLPLGRGPHVCIGKALSTIILTTTLACILREFRVRFTLDQPPQGNSRLLSRHATGSQSPRATQPDEASANNNCVAIASAVSRCSWIRWL